MLSAIVRVLVSPLVLLTVLGAGARLIGEMR